MSEKIIKLSDKLHRPPITIKRQRYDGCRHMRSIEVDGDLRTVHCGDCEAILDPVQVLIEFAHAYRQQDYRIDTLRKEEQRYKDRLEKQRQRRKKP